MPPTFDEDRRYREHHAMDDAPTQVAYFRISRACCLSILITTLSIIALILYLWK